MKKGRIGGILAFVAVCVAIFLFAMHQRNNRYIDFVKQGSPVDYPNITYEKAFNNYFGDCKWTYFKSEDDEDVVEFNGICSYRGQDAKIKIQFLLDVSGGTFVAYTAAIDGVLQSTLDLQYIITTVFEDY